jgi:hypothetical protein
MLGRVVVNCTEAADEVIGSVVTVTLLRAAHPPARIVANVAPVTKSTKYLLFMFLSSFRLFISLLRFQMA